MPVCPLDFRYGREQMRHVFSEEYKLQKMLDVEAALARAHAKLGNIPPTAAEAICQACNVRTVTIERVSEIEAEIKHDIMAMVKAITEAVPEHGKYVHLGATSNDIIDTASALQLKEAVDILEAEMESLVEVLADQTIKHRNTVMLGRTHGQAAVPITFGLKTAVYAAEMHRHLVRLRECEHRLLVGKMTGAVGTGAALGPKALEIQEAIMAALGLGIEEGATQLVGRDRYAEFICLCGSIASSLEKMATEIRNLQRSEIDEVAEAFDTEKQVGSSTMAHKKNPITCENVCGLARVIRSYVAPQYEDMVLWHERDLTNSSSERFILTHVCVLLDDILAKMVDVFRNIAVKPDNMLANIEATKGLVLAEAVMIELSNRGMSRQDAHEMTRQCSMKAREKGVHLKEVLLEEDIELTDEEIVRLMDPRNYLGVTQEIIDHILETVKLN